MRLIPSSPNAISFWSACIICGLSILPSIIYVALDLERDIIFVLINVIVIVASSYLIIRNSIQKFLYDKIKLIYRNILHLKFDERTEKELKSLNMNKDILTEVDQQVQQWADAKSEEIQSLKQQEEFRREFIGNVSHELKTPTFNIQGYVLTLLDGGLEDETINRKYLERAGKSVERMIAIIDDLEMITRLESGNLELELEVFDLGDLIRDIYLALEMQSRRREITLELGNMFDKPIKVEADKSRIRQVLVNLLVNSIKYGRDGGNTGIRVHDMDNVYLVEVSDDGIGISEKDLPRLFERFYRVDKSRSRDQGGTGLGLSIVKHIIEAHGQTINVRSTVDLGSTFSFTIKKGK